MAGLKQGAQLVGWIRRAAHDHCQVAFEDLYLAGPVIDGLTVDVVSKRTLDSYAIPSTLVVFYICYLCLGSLRGALLVVSLSVVGQGGLVTPRAVLLEGLHDDPVEVAAEELAERGRLNVTVF